MLELVPAQQSQSNEVRRMMYTVANDLFHDRPTLEEAIDYYSYEWPLPDLDDIQANYCDKNGAFFVWVDDGRVVGSGALKKLEEKVGEIKRLWLLPEYQGRKLGYQMMQKLMAVAREKGYALLRLETSPAYQPRAYAFYHKLGFYDIPRYGDEDDDIGMELVLS